MKLHFLSEHDVLIFLERGDRVEQPGKLNGEIKARNGRVCRAMLGVTGRVPFLPTGLSL